MPIKGLIVYIVYAQLWAQFALFFRNAKKRKDYAYYKADSLFSLRSIVVTIFYFVLQIRKTNYAYYRADSSHTHKQKQYYISNLSFNL